MPTQITTQRDALPGDLVSAANQLIRDELERFNPKYGVGSMEPSIYDTAWVSMVYKDDKPFSPASFQYILDQQDATGGWGLGTGSHVDSIIHTLAALLAIKIHISNDDIHSAALHLSERVVKAECYLNRELDRWDVSATERVGFAVIVPNLLSLLSNHDSHFDFREKSHLLQLKDAKLAKLKPELIYKFPTTVLHSLEAFVGVLDFDKLAHLKRHGHFLSSPSSVAAFLMNASKWDDGCEQYLRAALQSCDHYAEGVVSNLWPTTFFELSWITHNLLEGGLGDAIDKSCADSLVNIFVDGIHSSKGVIGCSTGWLPDADDSAKVFTLLHHFGVKLSIEPLRSTFELPTHFQCYPFETNTSITVHCNMLTALLIDCSERPQEDHLIGSSGLFRSVEKAVGFICEEWRSAESWITDKWNDSPFYSMLCICQSLKNYLMAYDKGTIPIGSEELIRCLVPLTLFQILCQVLEYQQVDGSWSTVEETAYAMLILSNLSSLPFVKPIKNEIDAVTGMGRQYILSHVDSDYDSFDRSPIWIGKIGYRIPALTRSYILAALHLSSLIPRAQIEDTDRLSTLIGLPSADQIDKTVKFFHRVPTTRHYEIWRLKAFAVEAHLNSPFLHQISHSIFDREGLTEQAYLKFIPYVWTVANTLSQVPHSVCWTTCLAMMISSVASFQIDEAMDTSLKIITSTDLQIFTSAVDDLFGSLHASKSIESESIPDSALSTAFDAAQRYVSFIISFPAVQEASVYDRGHLFRELKALIMSMVAQASDKARFENQSDQTIFRSSDSSLSKWVRTGGAEQVTGLSNAALFFCLYSSTSQDALPTAELKFIAQDCFTHFSALARLWNDLGNIDRDKLEMDVNSINFPEFTGLSLIAARQELRNIAAYESRRLRSSGEEFREVAIRTLGEVNGKKWVIRLEFVVTVGQIFNEIYQLKDISSSMAH